MLVPDPIYGGFKTQKCWSCCRQTDINAPGCLTRPHVCKELMLSIRAESGIPALIADIDVTIFQTLEISVFPGCEYCIHVEISSQVLEMLHNYFDISDATMIDEDDIGDGVAEDRMVSVDSDRKNSKDDDRLGQLVDKINLHQTESSTESNMSPKLIRQSSEEASQTEPTHSTSPHAVVAKQEALFIKYLRVGHIAVEVNTVGFAFNLEKYKAIVNEFSLRNKVLDWHRLIWKFEMHIALCMTSHTATSSMNKLWTIMFGKSDEKDQSKGISRYHDDDTTTKKILLLGE